MKKPVWKNWKFYCIKKVYEYQAQVQRTEALLCSDYGYHQSPEDDAWWWTGTDCRSCGWPYIKPCFNTEHVELLKATCANRFKQKKWLAKAEKVIVIVAVNVFATDTEAEISLAKEASIELGRLPPSQGQPLRPRKWPASWIIAVMLLDSFAAIPCTHHWHGGFLFVVKCFYIHSHGGFGTSLQN